MRNYRQEIEVALSGGIPDHVPFSFYDGLLADGFDPSRLQAKGMAICARRNVCEAVTPNVVVEEVHGADGSVRTTRSTPIGSLSSLTRPAAVGRAIVEHPIKTRDDYRVAEFIVRDTRYQPDYDTFLAARAKVGDLGFALAHTCYTPLLDIQVMWVGQERFCYELADNEDALICLCVRTVCLHGNRPGGTRMPAV